VVVGAGERVRLLFVNGDDMLHNLLIVRPEATEKTVTAATYLGLEGTARHFVPDDADVLYHTALLQPSSEAAIHFLAPATPGRYTYVCTFPGPAVTMRGEMIVR